MNVQKDLAAANRVASTLYEHTKDSELVVIKRSDLIELLKEAHMQGQGLGHEVANIEIRKAKRGS